MPMNWKWTARQRGESRPFLYFRRLSLNASALAVSDALALLLALFLAGFIRYLFKDQLVHPTRGYAIIPVWWFGAVCMRIIPGWGLGPVEELRRMQILLMATYGLALVALFVSQTSDLTSRMRFVLMYLQSAVYVPVFRAITKRCLHRFHAWGVPTVVYGNDRMISHVLEVMRQEWGLGYIPYGVFDDEQPVGSTLDGLPVLGAFSESTDQAPFAFVGVPSIPRERLAEQLEGPLARYRRVVLMPDLLDIPSLWVSTRDFMGVLGLELVRNLLNPAARWGKEIAELAFVVATSVVWIPLGILIALVVWVEDRHNPFFIQKRIGRNGKVFRAWKFRTMVPNAEEVLRRQMQNPDFLEKWDGDFKLKHDHRVTHVGRILRRTSLDELPQLVNVLKGEMSLIGPRPLPYYHHERIATDVQELRKLVLPGITGLWQVSGRSDTGTAGMEKWDTYYVRNWSIWLDLVILMRTFQTVWSKKGAY